MSGKPEERDKAPGGESASGSGGAFSVSRRAFLQTIGAATGVASLNLDAGKARAEAGPPSIGPGSAKLSLKINGQAKTVEVEPRTTLLDAIRDGLDMTGSKKVCDRGSCGACTVMLDGESVCSCMMLAADARGAEITTIEGLAGPDGKLDPIQAAFIECDASQCGFCTPGFVVRCRSFLNENASPSLDQIKEGLAGNICRCGTYTHIFAAVQQAAGKKEA